jgi:hypothetical protein
VIDRLLGGQDADLIAARPPLRELGDDEPGEGRARRGPPAASDVGVAAAAL